MGEYVNSRQIRVDKSHVSCGVIEAHHIPKDVQSALFSVVNSMYHKANGRPGAFIIFSDAMNGDKRGEQLAAAIERIPNFGSLVRTQTMVNPKTGNPICLWVWTVNHEAVRKWYTDEYVNRITEEF